MKKKEREELLKSKDEQERDLFLHIEKFREVDCGWQSEYDYRKDDCYERPVCPLCTQPLFDDFEQCPNCGLRFKQTEQLKKYIKDNIGSKVEYSTCLWCGGEDTMRHYLYKHRGKWVVGHGNCIKCKASFIV